MHINAYQCIPNASEPVVCQAVVRHLRFENLPQLFGCNSKDTHNRHAELTRPWDTLMSRRQGTWFHGVEYENDAIWCNIHYDAIKGGQKRKERHSIGMRWSDPRGVANDELRLREKEAGRICPCRELKNSERAHDGYGHCTSLYSKIQMPQNP